MARCAPPLGARSAAGRSRCRPATCITVGAGGGSIAWRDAGGALRVGPRSAGARPGPACYGHGGTLPTVTDANLLLGRLGDGSALAGGLRLDRVAADQAIAGLAGELGIEPLAAAAGIVRIADLEMLRATSVSDDRARHRSARSHPGGLRRSRADARGRRCERARCDHGDVPGRVWRALRLRNRRGRTPPRPLAERRAAARRFRHGRARATDRAAR